MPDVPRTAAAPTPAAPPAGAVPPSRMTATIALPTPHTTAAVAALRSVLQQLLLDQQGDGVPRSKHVLDWMTFQVTGPAHDDVQGPGAWFVYTATAGVTALDPA